MHANPVYHEGRRSNRCKKFFWWLVNVHLERNLKYSQSSTRKNGTSDEEQAD